jgi:hypothetical protein
MNEKHEKRRDALGLFYESVLKPDPELRNCAHNQKCFNELMEWRDEIIRYLDESVETRSSTDGLPLHIIHTVRSGNVLHRN